jgi:hypothetical protein
MCALGVGAASSCRRSGGPCCLLRTGLSGGQQQLRAIGTKAGLAPKPRWASLAARSLFKARRIRQTTPPPGRVVPTALVVLGMKPGHPQNPRISAGHLRAFLGSVTARMPLVERACGWRAPESHPGCRRFESACASEHDLSAPRRLGQHLANTPAHNGGNARYSTGAQNPLICREVLPA